MVAAGIVENPKLASKLMILKKLALQSLVKNHTIKKHLMQ